MTESTMEAADKCYLGLAYRKPRTLRAFQAECLGSSYIKVLCHVLLRGRS